MNDDPAALLPAFRLSFHPASATTFCSTPKRRPPPQTILACAYLEQIFAGLRDAGQAVFHVVLDAGEDVLRQRIQGSGEAQAWRLAHLAQYRASRPWMILAADLVVNTAGQTPSAVAQQIAGALPGL